MSSIKPTLCFIAPELYPVLVGEGHLQTIGGAEVQQALIARYLSDAGYSISVASLDFGQPDETVVDGIRCLKIHRVGKSIPGIRYFHPRLTGIWNAMRRANADIYYQRCAGATSGVVAGFCRLYGRRFIFSAASNKDFLPYDASVVRLWRDRQLFSWGVRRADFIVAQNDFQFQACKKWHGRDAVVIRNTYRIPDRALSSRDGVVLWVGVMRRGKRPHLLLQLAEQMPHVRFRMIGGRSTTGLEGRYYEEVEARARNLSNVEFLGFLPFHEADDHYNQARLFVNTSEFEGFPNTFLQSWARGIPTISFFDCGARDEDVKPIGQIVDSLEDMRSAVQLFWQDDTLWVEEGERARHYFRKYHSPEVVLGTFRQVIENLMDRT